MFISFKSATIKDEHFRVWRRRAKTVLCFPEGSRLDSRAKGTDSQELLHWKDLAELTDFSHSL